MNPIYSCSMAGPLARKIIGLCLAVFLLPIVAIPEGSADKSPNNALVCGTSPERMLNVLLTGRYCESLHRQKVLQGPVQASLQTDQGDVAVIENDGTIIFDPNSFDLSGKSFRFEPAGISSYRVASTSTAFNSAGGTSIVLSDDDSKLVSFGFSFKFYGLTYTSVQVNSDGNLTFLESDVAHSSRDLARFTSGPPRIGPFFADLDPTAGGVTHRSDTDGILFIWNKVPNFQRANSNNFAVKLFRNGNIEFVYDSRVDGEEAVVGISPGLNEGGVSAVDYSNALPTPSLAGSIVEVFSRTALLSETALAKKFYSTHPDDFDHLVVFLAFDYELGGAYAFEANVRNEIQGIGLALFDDTSFYGSKGRLRSFVMMGSLDGPGRYPSNPNQVYLGTNSTMGIMGQESGHRWLAFTPFQDGETKSTATLGRQLAHWSFFFNSEGSVMEGNEIEDKGNGQFLTIGATYTYSSLDQYIMGLLGKEDVADTFLVENTSGTGRNPNSAPAVGIAISGARKNVTVDTIIAANGARVPSVLQSPKVFRQAFILLTKKGQTATTAQIAKVQKIRDAWVSFFNEQTGKRGWIGTDLQSSPGASSSNIYFPYFQGSSQRYTGIAVANWGSTPADVLFTAYDNDGAQSSAPSNIINPRMITIPPGQQIAMLAEQIHGLSLNDARNGWIQAKSTSSQLTGFFLDGDTGLSLLDGAVAGNQSATELFFSRAQSGSGLFGTQSYRNLIDVINPNASSATLQFKLLDEFGAVLATATRTLNARGRIAEDVSSLFPTIASPLKKGYIKLTSDVGVIGYQSVDGGFDIYSLPAQTASTSTKLYSAQFASGRAPGIRYFTDVNIINTSNRDRTVELLLVGNDGLAVITSTNPLTRKLAPGEQFCSRGDLIFGLIDPTKARRLTEGSLVVAADGPGIIGDVLFGDPTDERYLASLPLDGNPASNLVFPHVAQGSPNGQKPYFTDIAMYNPNDNDVVVQIEVYSGNGSKTGSASITLGRGERLSKTLPELVPAITNQVRGHLRLTTTGGSIVSLELIGDQSLEFLAAVPPQAIKP